MVQLLHVITSPHLIITLSFTALENIYPKSIYIKSLEKVTIHLFLDYMDFSLDIVILYLYQVIEEQ
jgi:hypothetical protein